MRFKDLWYLLKGAAQAFSDDKAPRLGAALAYYTVFAISPLIIIVLFVASLWFNRASVQKELFEQLGGLVGAKGAQTIQSTLAASLPHDQGAIASIIAAVALGLTATGLFIELQSALNTIWGVEAKPGQGIWGFVKTRLLSFTIVLGIGFLLLVSLVLSAALAAMGKYFSALVPGLTVLWTIANAVVSFGVITLLFAMIYKVLPDVRIRWREVWVGSITTALLFTIGKFLLGLYLGRNSTVSAYGAAGSLVLVLLWVFYSGQILFFGAEITQVYACRYGTAFEPKVHAQWVTSQPQAQKKPAPVKPSRASRRQRELVNDLRQEVETLRGLRDRLKSGVRS